MLPVLLIAAAIALAAVLALQVALPRIAARRIHERLTAGGGTARVEIAAMPATKLLHHRGDRIRVRGRGLTIGLATEGPPPRTGPPPGLAALDGFAEVDLELVDFRAGPFAVDAFVLSRSGSAGYAMATQARATAAGLASLGLERLPGLPGAGLIGSVANSVVGEREVSVRVEVELISEAGGLSVGAGGGSIAGYPAGPLATAIAAAVARRLEIAP